MAHDVNQLGEYLESLSKEKNLSIERVFGLYVVGDESNIRALADQVRGSKYSHFIRVISVDNLLKLAEMAEKAELKPSHVYRLLIPIDSVNAGELIKLIEVIIEAHRGELTQPKPGVEESILAEDFVKEPDVVRMEELKKMEDGAVLICSSRSENVKFLLKFNAWGFIRQPRKMPRYFALYVGRPRSQLEYIGEIDRIIDPKDPASPVSNPEDYGYDPSENKKLIVLKDGSLRKLASPLKLENAFPPLGPRYTTLRKIANAEILDDILS